jgi:hypothetical protein
MPATLFLLIQGEAGKEFEPVTLDSLAPVSHGGVWNILGKWSSNSKYIQGNKGEYYVRNDQDPSKRGWAPWPWPPKGVEVGYFFEEGKLLKHHKAGRIGDIVPFMILFKFRPEKLQSHWYGMFMRPKAYVGDLKFRWFNIVPGLGR